MTQADFIQAVHNELGPDTKVSKTAIEDVLKAAGNVGLHALGDGGEAYLFGLGKIKVVQRAARKGRNPRTGAEINVPAKPAAKYFPSKAVKDGFK
ncbi:MAG: DNA-binding protein HU [Desulfovibrio sp.]